MRCLISVVLAIASIQGFAEIYRCEPPTGTMIHTLDKHEPAKDGFKDMHPIVITDNDRQMKIGWGDSAYAGAQDIEWDAVVIYSDAYSLTGVVRDVGSPGNNAMMLYTLDKKRGFLYQSVHKNQDTMIDASFAASYVAKCSVSTR